MKTSRRAFLLSSAAFGASSGVRPLFGGVAPSLVKPTPQQAVWSDQELGLFFHMDIPIFQPRGKNVNTEHCQDILDPRIYNPAKLDTDQWMEAAKAMGAKYVVFVAYHGSGFMQWQSDLFPYGLKQSPWRGGKGDIVRDFMASARRRLEDALRRNERGPQAHTDVRTGRCGEVALHRYGSGGEAFDTGIRRMERRGPNRQSLKYGEALRCAVK